MKKIYIFSGAGLSAESGLSTFRKDQNGLWENYDLNKVCNYLTWKDNRELVFDFYSQRKIDILNAQPNKGHHTIAQWQKTYGEDNVIIMTQNIDNLLERAGCSKVTHLHGNIHEMKCFACGNIWNINNELYNKDSRCPKCNSLKGIKPNIVFFHEQAPEYGKPHKLRKKIDDEDFLIVVGTSLNVIPIEYLVPRHRVGHLRNIQINPNLEKERYFGINISQPASIALPMIEF